MFIGFSLTDRETAVISRSRKTNKRAPKSGTYYGYDSRSCIYARA